MKRTSEVAGPEPWLGRIAKIEESPAMDRLKSMGIFVGQTVEITRLGAHCLLVVAGSRVAVGDELAGLIWVESLTNTPGEGENEEAA